MKLLLSTTLIIAELLFMNSAFASVSVTPEVSAGYTDNVYQDDQNKTSDSFAGLRLIVQNKNDDSATTGSLGATLYNRESANNYLTYLLKHKFKWPDRDFSATVALGGVSYLKTQSGATDNSYNNTYLTSYLTIDVMKKENFNLQFEPGFKATSYPNLGNRRDLYLFARLNGDITLNEQSYLNPYIEIGLNRSSDSYYNRNDLNLGVMYMNEIEADLNIFASLNIAGSTYSNRKVSQILTTTKGNGRVTTTSNDALETSQYTTISLGVEKMIDQLTLFSDITHSSYTTKSNLEYFNENQIVVGLRATY